MLLYVKLIRTYMWIIYQLFLQKPLPIEAWEGVKSAEKAPPAAATVFLDPKGGIMISPGSSEDCLYLNVYMPPVSILVCQPS